jgi:hypothetical protein
VARPERFELPTLWFEARCSIQLSYGRVDERGSVYGAGGGIRNVQFRWARVVGFGLFGCGARRLGLDFGDDGQGDYGWIAGA